MLTIQLFGLFQAELNGNPLPELALNNAQRLLCFMALQEGRPAQATWIASSLWPRTHSLDSLRKSIQQLRKALGTEALRLQTQNSLISLNLDGLDLDIAAFDAAASGRDDASLGKAIDLYRDTLLKDWQDPWVMPYREFYEAQYVSAVDRLLQSALEKNQRQAAVTLLRRAVSHAPDIESWWIKLIELQALTGASLEALSSARRYYSHVNRTRSELGLSVPGSQTIADMVRKIQMNQICIAADPAPNVTLHEAVGGATPAGSPYYVERPEDSEVRRAISNHTSIVLIKGSYQTGKSSLVARALRYARDEGIAIIRTAWHTLGDSALIDVSSFIRSQLAAICKQVQIDVDIEQELPGASSPTVNFDRFVRDQLLHKIQTPVLWAIDDADRLFASCFRDDVFSLFRAWHNERAYNSDDPLNRFTLLISYSAEAHLAIRSLNRSPFNVGTRVTLGDFTYSQVICLNERYDQALTEADLLSLFDLVGGHPYLLRKALYEVRNRNHRISDIFARSEAGDGIFMDHLNRMLEAVRQDPEIFSGLRRVLEGGACSEVAADKLCAAGVLVVDPSAGLRPRCVLYDRFLRRRIL